MSVRGEAETRLTPEIAIVQLTVQQEGPERSDVVARTSSLAEEIRHELEDLTEQGAISAWFSDQIAVWANRPWNNEGIQLDFVHYASLPIRATFTDMAELSGWLSTVAVREGLRIESVTWDLTSGSRRQVEQETATRAVVVAAERASAYAAAIGKQSVTPIHIADAGLLNDSSGGRELRLASPMMAKSAAYDSGVDLRFTPEPIIITASVEAQFEAE